MHGLKFVHSHDRGSCKQSYQAIFVLMTEDPKIIPGILMLCILMTEDPEIVTGYKDHEIIPDYIHSCGRGFQNHTGHILSYDMLGSRQRFLYYANIYIYIYTYMYDYVHIVELTY